MPGKKTVKGEGLRCGVFVVGWVSWDRYSRGLRGKERTEG